MRKKMKELLITSDKCMWGARQDLFQINARKEGVV